jgi:DNA polymerase bacteriophage-type
VPQHVDLETRSGLDLKKVGAYRYAEDSSTEILLAHARGCGLPVLAHNAGFERTLLNSYGAGLRPEDQACTLARANALNLPANLEDLGKALGAAIQKDKDGHRLMLKMCKASYSPKPGEMARLQAYCDQDVLSEAAIDAMLPALSDFERKVWVLDQHINDRGFAVDVPVIERALLAVHEATRRADRKMWELTAGAVETCSQAARIVTWLRSRGLAATSIAEGEHDELMLRCEVFGDDLAREVIDLRQATSKTFKFQSMLDTACRDGRIRGTLVYQGALSGRWTGRIPQPHNMKRVETEEDERTVADALDILQQPMSASGHVSALEVLCGPPLDALSLCARAMIVAPRGRKLVGGDFSNIEGRINAWINGEMWKVRAFRDYDEGVGPDLYRVMASSILGKARDDISKDDRQLWGKVPELACGYQWGVNAFAKMGRNYGVRVDPPLARRIVAGWRDANPGIVAGWAELQSAAISAVERPGMVVPCLSRFVLYNYRDGFLWCRLPSGRCIAYPGAVVEWKRRIVVIDGDEVEFDNQGVSFWGQKGGWRKLDLYGGMQMAHVVSGIARDIMAEALLRLDPTYPVVLHIHDEALSEVDEDCGSADEYRRIMEVASAWTAGLPITAKAWEGPVYAH